MNCKKNATNVIDLDTARDRVIARLAEAEQAEDRERVATLEREASDACAAEARIAEASKLEAESRAHAARGEVLDVEAGKLVAQLVGIFRERGRLSSKRDDLAVAVRVLRGEASPRWGDRAIEFDRRAAARTVKEVLLREGATLGGFTAWITGE